MAEKTFIASRISNNENILFPDKIIINDTHFTFYKGNIIGYKKCVVNRSNISSVYIRENILFADVFIESKGGRLVVARGFLKVDAREIINILT